MLNICSDSSESMSAARMSLYSIVSCHVWLFRYLLYLFTIKQTGVYLPLSPETYWAVSPARFVNRLNLALPLLFCMQAPLTEKYLLVPGGAVIRTFMVANYLLR